MERRSDPPDDRSLSGIERERSPQVSAAERVDRSQRSSGLGDGRHRRTRPPLRRGARGRRRRRRGRRPSARAPATGRGRDRRTRPPLRAGGDGRVALRGTERRGGPCGTSLRDHHDSGQQRRNPGRATRAPDVAGTDRRGHRHESARAVRADVRGGPAAHRREAAGANHQLFVDGRRPVPGRWRRAVLGHQGGRQPDEPKPGSSSGSATASTSTRSRPARS